MGHRTIPLAAAMLLGMLAHSGNAHAGGAKSPEEAFKAMTKAAEARDAKAFLGNLTSDSQKILTGAMVTMAAAMKQSAGFLGGDPKDFDNLLTKHKINADKVMAGITMGDAFLKKDGKAIMEIMKSFAGQVADQAVFLGDVLEVMRRQEKLKFGQKHPFDEMRNATLKDLSVTGNTAKGQMTTSSQTQEVHFVREASGWKVDLMPMFMKAFK